MSRIGFIGTGHIAAPMVRFLCDRGHEVTVSDRNAQTAAALEASHGVKVADNQAVIDRSDIVFLCLRPHLAEEILTGLSFGADQKVISVMAGVSLAHLHALCAPADDICMTIPLGYLEQGGCPLPACPRAEPLASLFAPDNPVFEVRDEAALNQHFAVCAFVPGMLDLMVTASDWLGNKTGDRDAAARYTQQLLAGFLASMSEDGVDTLSAARDALATKGTLSLQMTDGVRAGGAHDVLKASLDAIGTRLGGT